MRSGVLVLGLALSAAACVPDAPLASPSVVVPPAPPPPPPPNSPDAWRALDLQAHDKVVADGFVHTIPAIHLTSTLDSHETDVNVEGGRCYLAVSTWSFDRPVILSVYSHADTRHQFPNKHVRGAEVEGPPPMFAQSFCTDHGGYVTIALRPQGPTGREPYEYSLVVGWRSESVAEAKQRHDAENADDAEADARAATHVANAAASRQSTADEHCRPCHDDYTACQVMRATDRRGQVVNACETAFRACATRVGERMYMGDRAALACGPLPR